MTAQWSFEIYPTLDSTQSHVKSLAEQGANDRVFVQALQQTSGHGRHGRAWISPVGNFYGSFILRPKKPLAEIPQLALVVGVALAYMVAQYTDQEIILKWPNDVLVNGKKCAGILLEIVDDAIVVGIGVNVASAPDDAFALGAGIDLIDVRDKFIRAFQARYDAWLSGDFPAIRTAWLERGQQIGAKISVKHGAHIIEGHFEGLDLAGNMMIKNRAGKMQTLSSGDVHFGWKEGSAI